MSVYTYCAVGGLLHSWRIMIYRLYQTKAKFFSSMTSAITLVIILLAPKTYAEGLISFDIKKQRADKALINFAQKANKTIFFPFELTKQYQANKLKGYYSSKCYFFSITY